MDAVKHKFMDEIAKQLAAAPNSRAKSELVEELAENLTQRYQSMTAAGTPEDEAFSKAMEDLGDVNELIDYLESLEQEPGQEQGSAARPDPLDELMHDVEDITRNAFDLAKQGLRQVKERLRNEGFYRYRSPGGHVEVHVNDDKEDRGYTANDDGGSTKWGQPKDVIYGVGYDKKKGGFFAQWGEWKGENYMHVSSMAPIPAQNLRGVDVQNVSGDVNVYLNEDEDGDILVAGDADQLEISCTEDGVLQVRPGSTASSSFLFSRGVRAADVELRIPCRNWDFIRIKTVNGDVELEGDCYVESVRAESVNGDVDAQLAGCGRLELKTASGDIDWNGSADKVSAECLSGDLELNGDFNSIAASTMSGDVEIAGAVSGELKASSMNGDVRLETGMLPQALTVSSKSGDCQVRIEESGPFTVKVRTVSGDVDSDYPITKVPGGLVCGIPGDGPQFSVSTVSGDVRILRY